jgi:hypothetical protein
MPREAVRQPPQFESNIESPRVAASQPRPSMAEVSTPPETPTISSRTGMELMPSIQGLIDSICIMRTLSSLWLAGCLLLGLKLLATALIRSRLLSACRLVSDAAVLELLETSRRRIGLKRTPALLVTAECQLICIAHRSPNGTETYVLRALEMKVRELNPRYLRNLRRSFGVRREF